MKPIWASSLDRLMACGGELFLPWIEHPRERSTLGREVHAVLEAAQENVEEALEGATDRAKEFLRNVDLSSLPLRGEAMAEVHLEWHGIAGRADIIGLAEDEDRVVVGDYKTYVPSIRARDSWQLRFYAIAACQRWEKSLATVFFAVLKENGDVWIDRADFDAFELAEFMAALERRLARWQAHSGVPDVRTGPHCRFCPALESCPAYTRLAAAIGTGEALQDLERAITDLTTENKARVLQRVRQAEEVIARVKQALAQSTLVGDPIPVGNGKVWGAIQREKVVIAPTVARKILTDLYGPEVADAACRFTISQTGIEGALRPLAKEMGKPLAHLKREAMQAIEQAGGVEVKMETQIREYKP